MTTLDRESPKYAVLTTPTGSVYDVYGEDWTDLCREADAIAASLGLKIDNYNCELPEA